MDTPRAVLALALGFGGSHGALVIEHRPPGMEDAGSAAPGVPSADRSVRHRADSLQDEDPPPDWPARLATRLGTRPRRLGPWAELALWGARRCLDGAGLDALPAGARLCVLSLSGPVETLREGLKALDQDGAPMPYTFLQSQPAVMLAGLGAHLGWQGDALCLATRDLVHGPGWLAPEGGLLLGWVDERPRPVSRWQWWAPGGERHLT